MKNPRDNKIGIVIQARTSSTRLPGKVLKELPWGSGVSVLGQVIRRAGNSGLAGDVVIATTTGKEDDAIVKIAEKEGVRWFRGDRDDVLSRYYYASKENDLDIVVRVTSDCPCIDPVIMDSVIKEHVKNNADFTTNALARSFPHGLDLEVIAFSALEEAFNKAKKGPDREHVAPYIYRTHPEGFKIIQVEAKGKLKRPEIRITLDTEEDYSLLCCVYDHLYSKDKMFYAEDIVDLFDKKPWLALINKKVMHKKIFDSVEEEIAESLKVLELQDLKEAARFMRGRFNESFNSDRGR